MKFRVEPTSKKTVVPPHPVEGPMPEEGGADWIADQYTLRLILDGVIRRVDADEDGGQERKRTRRAEPSAELSADAPPKPEAAAESAQSEPVAAALPAPVEKIEPAPGTVASVPFMITAANRKRLKALGRTDDEIAQMKPEEAQAVLAEADGASAAAAPKEA